MIQHLGIWNTRSTPAQDEKKLERKEAAWREGEVKGGGLPRVSVMASHGHGGFGTPPCILYTAETARRGLPGRPRMYPGCRTAKAAQTGSTGKVTPR